jgi:hypothetical protein
VKIPAANAGSGRKILGAPQTRENPSLQRRERRNNSIMDQKRASWRRMYPLLAETDEDDVLQSRDGVKNCRSREKPSRRSQ